MQKNENVNGKKQIPESGYFLKREEMQLSHNDG